MKSFSELNIELIAIVKEAGAFIRHERMNFDQQKVEHKGTNDLVSYVDKEAEKRLVTALSKILPGSGFITEEKTIDTGKKEYNWIIDPLDGTTNFIHNLPVYSISIALYHHDEPVMGVVYEICKDECFYAWKGSKAYLNGKEINVTANTSLASALVATGFPYSSFSSVDQYLAILKSFMEKTHGVRRMGSAAVDLAYVACGRFDAFFEYNLNAWDVAAGAFIVQQAGGQVCNFKGGDEFIEIREIMASNHQLKKEMLEVLTKF